jgi:plastocyanin
MTVLAAAVVLGACEASTTDPPTIVIEEMRFVPSRLDATVGVPLTVRIVNRSPERHDLALPSLHMPGLQGVDAILEPGETRTITLRFDRPGTHTFRCSIAKYAAAGMTGAVFVAP